jgi:hypothetical protein
MRRAVAVSFVAAAVAVGACGGTASPSGTAATSGPPATATTAGATPSHPAIPTRFPLPTQALAVDPCRLTAAEISAVVKFAVTKKAKNNPGQCEYLADPGGSVWFSVDAASVLDQRRDKNDETFSLGGRYVTIADEKGFAHEAFTAVKNPGDKSPGVIADFQAWLAPGHLKIRIYYPQGGTPPGRANVLTLAHKMLG